MSVLLLSFLAVPLLGLIVAAPLYFAVKNASTGYEDNGGFHGDAPPRDR